MNLNIKTIAEWIGGNIAGNGEDLTVCGVSIDSRTIVEGELFIALKGPNFDGHDYIAEAFGKGAAAAISQNEENLAGRPGIVVNDTLQALGNMAHHYRWRERLIPWVAVTGTNGKTTTRQMLRLILQNKGTVANPPGNYNNLVGLPLSILRAPADAWAGVLEMGTSCPCEISRLAEIATPTISILTSIGPGHLEGLGSIESVAAEKAAIFDRLPHDGIAILPADCPCPDIVHAHIPGRKATFGIDVEADMVAQNISLQPESSTFTVNGTEFQLPLAGRHNICNCLAALLAAGHLGVSLEDAAAELKQMKPVENRLQVIKTRYFTIINDVYNANPQSLKAAVEAMDAFPSDMRRVVAIGDMLELGKETRKYHIEAGRYLAAKGIAVILAVGKEAVWLAEGATSSSAKSLVRHFRSLPMLLRRDERYVKPGDLILVKGSRGMHMERLTETLKVWRP